MQFRVTVGTMSLFLMVAGQAPLHADDTGLAETLHDVQREKRQICMIDHFHYGAGENRKKRLAKKSAISDWANLVAWEYGTDWASFRRAGSKSNDCKETLGVWTCHVEARPCRRIRKRR